MSKKMTSRDLQAEKTYQKLLETSMALVKTHGYNKVTISQICDASGYAKGTFYKHFDSKNEILYHLAIKLNENMSTYFSYDETKSAKELYLTYMHNYMKLINVDGFAFSKNYLQMLISESMGGEKVGLHIQKEYIYYLLNKGVEQGEFTKKVDHETFFNLWQVTILGVLAMWAIEEDHYDILKDGYGALAQIINIMI